jgi:hypothetical protein
LHGDTDIGLRQRRRIVGAIAAHGDKLALGLLVTDESELFLWRRLGEESSTPASAAMAAAVIG